MLSRPLRGAIAEMGFVSTLYNPSTGTIKITDSEGARIWVSSEDPALFEIAVDFCGGEGYFCYSEEQLLGELKGYLRV